MKENPVLVVAISDFNAKLKNWYFEDSATFRECIRQYCLTTRIKIGHKEPTHILDNSSQCSDLISTTGIGCLKDIWAK